MAAKEPTAGGESGVGLNRQRSGDCNHSVQKGDLAAMTYDAERSIVVLELCANASLLVQKKGLAVCWRGQYEQTSGGIPGELQEKGDRIDAPPVLIMAVTGLMATVVLSSGWQSAGSLKAVEMNHVGTLPPPGRHGITDPVKVSYHRLLLVLGTVGLRQRLGPHVRTRNDGNSGIGPAQDLRLLELLTSRDTGSKGS